MLKSKIEGLSAIIGIFAAFVAGASFILLIRDDINDLNDDVKNIKERVSGLEKESLARDKEFRSLTLVLENKNKDLEKLESLLEKKYIDKKTKLASEYIIVAIEYQRKSEYQLSIPKLEKALKIEPNNIKALRLIGMAYRIDDNKVKALKYLSRAIKIDSRDSVVLRELGFVYSARSEHEQAIEYFLKARKYNQPVDYHLASSYRKMGQYKKGLEYAEKEVKNYPNKYPSYVARSDAFYDLERYEEAIKDYEKAIELREKEKTGMKIDFMKSKLNLIRGKFNKIKNTNEKKWCYFLVTLVAILARKLIKVCWIQH